jgi:hypothetical protein
MNKRITEDQAKKLYYRSLRIEQEFAEHFTGMKFYKLLCINRFKILNSHLGY